MELAFVIDSVRRYFWVVVLGALAGGAAAAGLQTLSSETFESKAVLLLTPPFDASGRVSDSERYVASQIAILGSAGLAEQAADELGDGFSAADVGAAITVEHPAATDIVTVLATTEDPERSQRIAASLVDTYFAALESQVDTSQGPEAAQLAEQLSDLRDRIEAVDAQIETAMAPFISPGSGGELPTPEQLVPALVSDRLILLTEHNQVQAAATELSLNSRRQVTSEIVQEPTLPAFSAGRSGKLLVAAGLVAGSFLGLLGAVVLARLSPRVLGIRHAAEILEQPLVGPFPKDRYLASDRLTLSPAVVPFVDLVCVRAEAGTRAGECLVVVVTGTERSSGTTTVAAAMANRYAAHGSRVLLIDADARDPELTRLFAADALGIPRLLELAPAGPGIRTRADGAMAECFRRTSIPNLSVLGFGHANVAVLRRQNVATLLEVARAFADVVVVDAGPLMDAASSVEFASVADAIVLAVPDRQRAATLDVVARQLRNRRGALLAVWVPAGSSRSPERPSSESRAEIVGAAGITTDPRLSAAIERARAHVGTGDDADGVRDDDQSGDPGLARSGYGFRFQDPPGPTGG